jgi:polyphosphate glucokinase
MASRRKHKRDDLRILSIDIGGTGLKASVVDSAGRLLVPRHRIKTPCFCSPAILLDVLENLVAPLPGHNRIAIGFPGVVRNDRILTAPHFQTKEWAGFPLADAASNRFGGAAKMVNDAEMQGLAVISGKGLELVLTLGTGAGTGLFRDGELMPHLELAQHPIYGKKKTYNDYIGDSALKKAGRKHWNERVERTIGILASLLHFDHLFIGGGNAQKIKLTPQPTITIVSNDAGIEGGAALWRPDSGVIR